MSKLDPRLTAARSDIAASALKGKVEAAKFVDGEAKAVAVGVAALRAKPARDAGLDTQLLFGERFTVYDTKDGWAWGQSAFDNYVGYVEVKDLGAVHAAPTHRVSALRSHVYPEADLKKPHVAVLPLNALVTVTREEGRYSHLPALGYVPTTHLTPVGETARDFVAVAEACLGVPYLWGGRTPDGFDCSGLLQAALECAGRAVPRDTDMQEKAFGPEISLAQVRRGDFVFWKGHVGVMVDAHNLLHANAFHMAVAREPLSEAIARIKASGNEVTSIRRLA